MKTLRNFTLATFLLVLVSIIDTYGQKKIKCDSKMFGDFVYKELSFSKEMKSMDIISHTVEMPAMFDYRIFVCPSQSLGDVSLKIYTLIDSLQEKLVYDSENTRKDYFELKGSTISTKYRIVVEASKSEQIKNGIIYFWIGTKSSFEKPSLKHKSKSMKKSSDEGIYKQ